METVRELQLQVEDEQRQKDEIPTAEGKGGGHTHRTPPGRPTPLHVWTFEPETWVSVNSDSASSLQN